MTCIVGVVDDLGVVVGADSIAVSNWTMTIRADPKVFRLGEFLIGFCGSYRIGQAIRYGFKPPKSRRGTDPHEYMATAFIDSLRERFRDAGCMGKENHRDDGGTILVGFRGRLFRIDADFQVGESLCGHAAIGMGEEIALGALWAVRTLQPNIGTELLVELALRAAEKNNAGVREPFHILHLPNKGAGRGEAKAKK
jgi:ATP-dependent protease HslVU (ClpYQ) peptidase subunit